MEVTIQEAAKHLGVSESAVRRRLRAGTMEGRQERIASGFRWVCILPINAYVTPTLNGTQSGELLEFLREQIRVKDEQIGILFDQLREANTRLALPAPQQSFWTQPWWKIWKTTAS